MVDWPEVAIRLLLSSVIGALVGLEREKSRRPAGLRTHLLVTVGSTLIMLISIRGFSEATQVGDPARLAAQVVSGIGFLGAGTIFKSGSSIKGLTTAASLWVCGGIGLGIGAGYYFASLLTTVISIAALSLLAMLERNQYSKSLHQLTIYFPCGTRVLADIKRTLKHYDCDLVHLKVRQSHKTTSQTFESYATFNVYLKELSDLEEINNKLIDLNDNLVLDWQRSSDEMWRGVGG